jgi:hypothetical protein
MFPSSYGLTFSIDVGAGAIQIAARRGFYNRLDSERLTTPKGGPERVWKRRQIDEVSPPSRSDRDRSGRCRRRSSPTSPSTGVARRQGDEWIVTLFLVSGQEEPKLLRDKAWLFQPELAVTAPDGAAVFRKRVLPHDPARLDPRIDIRRPTGGACSAGVFEGGRGSPPGRRLQRARWARAWSRSVASR